MEKFKSNGYTPKTKQGYLRCPKCGKQHRKSIHLKVVTNEIPIKQIPLLEVDPIYHFGSVYVHCFCDIYQDRIVKEFPYNSQNVNLIDRLIREYPYND